MSKKDDKIIEMFKFCGDGEDCVVDCPYHYLRDVDEYGPYWSGSCEACTKALERDYNNVLRKKVNYGKCKTCQFFSPYMISVDFGECLYGCLEDGTMNWNKYETARIDVEGTQSCKNYIPYDWHGLNDFT